MKKILLLPLLFAALFVSGQQKPQPKPKIKIACVGNSITFGAGLSNQARDSYPSVLGQMLGKEYDVRNFGVSGRTMLSTGDNPYMNEGAYTRALAFDPDFVLIKLGTNDSKPQNWRYSGGFEKDMETMIDAFEALPSKPRILLCLPAKAYHKTGSIRDSVIVAGVIPAIERVAARRGLQVVDMHTATEGMEENFPDKIHPNAAGCIVLAQTAYKAITGNDIQFKAQAFPGIKSGWRGYDKYDFQFNGRNATVVVPKDEAPGKPWIWRPAFFGAFPSVDIAMLAKGYHVVFYDVAFLYGSPRSVSLGEAFYDGMLKYYGFSKKVVVEGFSRGGLFAVNWAAKNPGKVACLYLDAPVCDVFSWPGRKSQGLWNELLKEWDLTDEQMAQYPGNPIDNLAPVAATRIPIIGVSGDSDRTVPYEENLGVLKTRYEKLGGRIEVILKPGCDHHPHSLEDPTPVVNFILKNSLR